MIAAATVALMVVPAMMTVMTVMFVLAGLFLRLRLDMGVHFSGIALSKCTGACRSKS
jgi:hypothetical protein